jgi:hypothetical protein
MFSDPTITHLNKLSGGCVNGKQVWKSRNHSLVLMRKTASSADVEGTQMFPAFKWSPHLGL